MTVVADLVATFRADTSELESGIQRAEQTVQSFGASADNVSEKIAHLYDMGGIAATAIGGTLVGAMVAGVAMVKDYTREVEGLSVQFDALLGSKAAGGAMVKQIEDFGVAMGQATKSVGAMASSLHEAGVTNTPAVWKDLTNMAEAHGVAVDSVAQRYAALMEMATRTEQLGGSMGSQSSRSLLGEGLISPSDSARISAMVNSGQDLAKVWQVIMDSTQKAKGAADEYSKTWAGLSTGLRNAFTADVGEAFYPLIKGIEVVMGDLKTLAESPEVHKFVDETAQTLDKLMGHFEALGSSMAGLSKGVNFDEFMAKIKQISPELGLIIGLVGTFGTEFVGQLPILNRFADPFDAFLKNGLGGLIGLTLGTQQGRQGFESLATAVLSLVKNFAEVGAGLSPILNLIGSAVGLALQFAAAIVSWLAGHETVLKIAAGLLAVYESIKLVGRGMDGITSLLQWMQKLSPVTAEAAKNEDQLTAAKAKGEELTRLQLKTTQEQTAVLQTLVSSLKDAAAAQEALNAAQSQTIVNAPMVASRASETAVATADVADATRQSAVASIVDNQAAMNPTMTAMPSGLLVPATLATPPPEMTAPPIVEPTAAVATDAAASAAMYDYGGIRGRAGLLSREASGAWDGIKTRVGLSGVGTAAVMGGSLGAVLAGGAIESGTQAGTAPNILGQVMQGAGTGAMLGSFMPGGPITTAAGGLIGALVPLISHLGIFGSSVDAAAEQLKNMKSSAEGNLAQLGSGTDYKSVVARADYGQRVMGADQNPAASADAKYAADVAAARAMKIPLPSDHPSTDPNSGYQLALSAVQSSGTPDQKAMLSQITTDFAAKTQADNQQKTDIGVYGTPFDSGKGARADMASLTKTFGGAGGMSPDELLKAATAAGVKFDNKDLYSSDAKTREDAFKADIERIRANTPGIMDNNQIFRMGGMDITQWQNLQSGSIGPNGVLQSITGAEGQKSFTASRSMLDSLGSPIMAQQQTGDLQAYLKVAQDAAAAAGTKSLATQNADGSITVPTQAEIQRRKDLNDAQMVAANIAHSSESAAFGVASAQHGLMDANFALTQSYFSLQQAQFGYVEALFALQRAQFNFSVTQQSGIDASAHMNAALKGNSDTYFNVAESLMKLTGSHQQYISGVQQAVQATQAAENVYDQLSHRYADMSNALQVLTDRQKQYQDIMSRPIAGTTAYDQALRSNQNKQDAVTAQKETLVGEGVFSSDLRMTALDRQLAILQAQAAVIQANKDADVGNKADQVKFAAAKGSEIDYSSALTAAKQVGDLNAQVFAMTKQQDAAKVSLDAANATLQHLKQTTDLVVSAVSNLAMVDQQQIDQGNSLVQAHNAVTTSANGMTTAYHGVKDAIWGVQAANQAAMDAANNYKNAQVSAADAALTASGKFGGAMNTMITQGSANMQIVVSNAGTNMEDIFKTAVSYLPKDVQTAVQSWLNAITQSQMSIGAGAPKPHRFASGGLVEDHSPRIFTGVDNLRIFNEPETGGEAYIPLGPNKRSTALPVLQQVMRMFGVDTYSGGGYHADTFAGSFYANGGVQTADSLFALAQKQYQLAVAEAVGPDPFFIRSLSGPDGPGALWRQAMAASGPAKGLADVRPSAPGREATTVTAHPEAFGSTTDPRFGTGWQNDVLGSMLAPQQYVADIAEIRKLKVDAALEQMRMAELHGYTGLATSGAKAPTIGAVRDKWSDTHPGPRNGAAYQKWQNGGRYAEGGFAEALGLAQIESGLTGIPVSVMLTQMDAETSFNSYLWRVKNNPAGLGATDAASGGGWPTARAGMDAYAAHLLGVGESGQGQFIADLRAGAHPLKLLQDLELSPWAASHYGGLGGRLEAIYPQFARYDGVGGAVPADFNAMLAAEQASGAGGLGSGLSALSLAPDTSLTSQQLQSMTAGLAKYGVDTFASSPQLANVTSSLVSAMTDELGMAGLYSTKVAEIGSQYTAAGGIAQAAMSTLGTLAQLGIPFMANGGIATSPTLAMIGENGAEAVVPLSQYAQGQSITIGDGAVKVDIVVHGNAPADLAQEVQAVVQETISELVRSIRVKGL